MRTSIAFIICLLIAGFLYVNYLQEKPLKDEIPAAGHPEELADTTRLDSAFEDAVSDTAVVWQRIDDR